MPGEYRQKKPKPKMTEKEYLEREKGWAEDVRLCGNTALKKDGWIRMAPQVEEFSSEDVRDSGFQQFKKKIKEEEQSKKTTE